MRLSLKLVSDAEGGSLEGREDQRLHFLLTRLRSHRESVAERRRGSKDLGSPYKELDLRAPSSGGRVLCPDPYLRPPTPSPSQSGFVEARQAGDGGPFRVSFCKPVGGWYGNAKADGLRGHFWVLMAPGCTSGL